VNVSHQENQKQQSPRFQGTTSVDPTQIEQFKKHVWDAGDMWGRPFLPWRQTSDPYAIYLSEVMLQQTQVSRVEKRWPRFLRKFPTLDALAAASNADVLSEWQGMGYNRRGLFLKKTAEICARDYAGKLPHTYKQLVKLPGIGDTTAAGIMAFAHQVPGVYLETNVRCVFIHEFFPDAQGVPDSQIKPLVAQTCSKENPRQWYYALMDWGTHIKATEPNPTRRAASYHKQSSFKGSRRQKRAFILRDVLDNPEISQEEVFADLNHYEKKSGRPSVSEDVFASIVSDLEKDGFFSSEQRGRHTYLVP